MGSLKVTIIDNLETGLKILRTRLKVPQSQPHLVIHFDEAVGPLWSDGVLKLQDILLEEHISVPVLPANSAEDVVNILEAYLPKAAAEVPAQTHIPSTKSVMAQATAAVPRQTLSSKDVDMVLTLFGSIHGLEQATRTDLGQGKLLERFGQRKAREMMEFWEDEWVM